MKYAVRLDDGTVGALDELKAIGDLVTVRLQDENGNSVECEGVLVEDEVIGWGSGATAGTGLFGGYKLLGYRIKRGRSPKCDNAIDAQNSHRQAVAGEISLTEMMAGQQRAVEEYHVNSPQGQGGGN